MADIVKINDIVTASIIEVNGISQGDIEKINDMAYPSITHSIVPAAAILYLDNQGTNSDSTSVNVTPNTMSTHSAKVDTGDGTNWFKINAGSTATGDFTLTVGNFGLLPTENKNAEVDISDDGSHADTVSVIISYSYYI